MRTATTAARTSGAVFVLLRLPGEAPRRTPGDVRRVVRTLGLAQLVLTVGLDREAVEVYLASAGLEVLGEADEVTGRGPDGASVTVRFDRLGGSGTSARRWSRQRRLR